jgi:hypothetical protein
VGWSLHEKDFADREDDDILRLGTPAFSLGFLETQEEAQVYFLKWNYRVPGNLEPTSPKLFHHLGLLFLAIQEMACYMGCSDP